MSSNSSVRLAFIILAILGLTLASKPARPAHPAPKGHPAAKGHPAHKESTIVDKSDAHGKKMTWNGVDISLPNEEHGKTHTEKKPAAAKPGNKKPKAKKTGKKSLVYYF